MHVPKRLLYETRASKVLMTPTPERMDVPRAGVPFHQHVAAICMRMYAVAQQGN